MPLDFQALADGVVRNNVGVDRIRLWADAETDGGQVVLTESDQRFPLDGDGPDAAGRHEFEVLGFKDGETTRLRFVRSGP